MFAAFLIFCVDFMRPQTAKTKLHLFALLGVGTALVLSAGQVGGVHTAFSGRFRVDEVAAWLRCLIYLATFLVLCVFSDDFSPLSSKPLPFPGEFLVALLFSVTGMCFLAASSDLILLYIGLELATLPLIGLTAWRKDELGGEAAIKYLFLSAIASSFLLLAMSYLYGITLSTSIHEISTALKPSVMTWFIASMLLASVGFKLALFPFHMWAPDTYQGAPITVMAFLSTASKVVGLALATHVFLRILCIFCRFWHL